MNLFFFSLLKSDRDWSLISKAIGTKTSAQVKSYHQEHTKNNSGRNSASIEKKRTKGETKSAKLKSYEVNGQKNDKNDVIPDEQTVSHPIAYQLSSHSADGLATRASSAEPTRPSVSSQLNLKEGNNRMGQELFQRQQEQLERDALIKRQQELSHLQRERDQRMHDSHHLRNATQEPRIAASSQSPSMSYSRNFNTNDVIQDLLNQQRHQQLIQQQQQQQQQLLPHQSFRSQDQQYPQQSALHQILSRHHHQGDQQLASRQPSQPNLYSQFPQAPVSHVLPQVQPQNRINHAQYSSRSHQQEIRAGSQDSNKSSEHPEIANLQRLIQMQQFHQNSASPSIGSLLGFNSSARTGMSTGVLSHLESLSRNSSESERQGPNRSITNAQTLPSSGNNNNNGGGNVVSDAFTALLSRMRDNNNSRNR